MQINHNIILSLMVWARMYTDHPTLDIYTTVQIDAHGEASDRVICVVLNRGLQLAAYTRIA